MTLIATDWPDAGATFSADRIYRLALWRSWGHGLSVNFVGLNPSTADESIDDPTIRRCIGFAKRWGFAKMYMTNLYSYRATQPRDLHRAIDPIGPENDSWLYAIASRCRTVVVAWGAMGHPTTGRVDHVLGILRRAHGKLLCLGTTQDGSPRHPLYIRADTDPIAF